MPRASATSHRDDGVWVPGIYDGMLAKEREKMAIDERRGRLLAVPGDPSAGFMRRSPHLLAALESGETVTVDSFRFPPGVRTRDLFPAHDGHRFTVSPDDVVRSVDGPGR